VGCPRGGRGGTGRRAGFWVPWRKAWGVKTLPPPPAAVENGSNRVRPAADLGRGQNRGCHNQSNQNPSRSPNPEFQVQVPAADLEARVVERLGQLKYRVQLRGFRPGKVPVNHLRKIYGKAVMAETIEAVIRELNAKIVSERGLKLAMEPKVTIPNE